MNKVQSIFHGPFAIVLTPFEKNGTIDYEELCRQMDLLCGTDIRGLVICGSTGEFISLSMEENMEIMRQAARVNRGRKLLVGGATAADYATSIRYLKHMAALGLDGALIAPPYYFPLGDADVEDFYRAVAGSGEIPVIAYQIPQFTSPISLGVYRRLLEMEGVCGLKNSSGNFNDIVQQLDLRNHIRPEFSVLTGSDEGIYGLLSVGGDGNFTALTHLFPELISLIYREFGQSERALECQMDLLPLLRMAGGATFPVGYKLLGEATGRFRFGEYRQAISPARREELSLLKGRMERHVERLRAKYGFG